MDEFLQAAYDEAQIGYSQGGIPIGSVLVIDGEIVGRGHNQRVQKQSSILHAEMDAIENAGRRKAVDYARSVLYTTLFPCQMCSGTSLLYGIRKIVIGEDTSFCSDPDYLRQNGVTLEVVDSQECKDMMAKFMAESPELWNEDIGE